MIWVLLIIFQFKHFLADYILQGSYMLGKFKDKGWVLPLAAHCGVHWLFTFWIVGFALPGSLNYTTGCILLFGLPTLDFVIHFIMDRIKASPKMLGRFVSLSKEEMMVLIEKEKLAHKSIFDSDLGGKINVPLFETACKSLNEIEDKKKSNVLFWWSLGVDQMVHHLTDILLIFIIMSYQ